jgi:DNA-binding transcriptional regulator YiaG
LFIWSAHIGKVSKMKPFPWKCGHCRERAVHPFVIPAYKTELEHDGRKYAIEVHDFEVFRCQNCHTVVLDDSANRILSKALRAAVGLLSPEEIRSERLALGLTQRDLAQYLRASESTISRWESGAQIQQKCLDLLLRGFFFVEEFRQYLGVCELAPLDLSSSDIYPPQLADEDSRTQDLASEWMPDLVSYSSFLSTEPELLEMVA